MIHSTSLHHPFSTCYSFAFVPDCKPFRLPAVHTHVHTLPQLRGRSSLAESSINNPGRNGLTASSPVQFRSIGGLPTQDFSPRQRQRSLSKIIPNTSMSAHVAFNLESALSKAMTLLVKSKSFLLNPAVYHLAMPATVSRSPGELSTLYPKATRPYWLQQTAKPNV